MASKHMSRLKAAAGEVSLHSAHGRHLMRAAFLDTLTPNGLHSSALSIGGEESLNSKYGRFVLRSAVGASDQEEFESVDGEKTIRSAFGRYLQP